MWGMSRAVTRAVPTFISPSGQSSMRMSLGRSATRIGKYGGCMKKSNASRTERPSSCTGA